MMILYVFKGHYEHVPSSLGTLLKLLHTVESISSVTVGVPCQCDSWCLAAAQAVVVCLFPPEFVLKTFTKRVINHLNLHMIAEVFQISFFQSGPNSREPGKNHLILFALNWNTESTISCSHFSKVIANWCELLNSLHLIAVQATQDDFTLNSSLIFGMCKSPWLFLVISWLKLFPQWCTPPPCMIVPLGLRNHGAPALLLLWCLCSPWMFSFHCHLHTYAGLHCCTTVPYLITLRLLDISIISISGWYMALIQCSTTPGI